MIVCQSTITADLVTCWATFGMQNSCNHFSHEFYKFLVCGPRKSVPDLQAQVVQLLLIMKRGFVSSELAYLHISDVLNIGLISGKLGRQDISLNLSSALQPTLA